MAFVGQKRKGCRIPTNTDLEDKTVTLMTEANGLHGAKSNQTWCLTSTETIRLIRDGENRGEGGMEVGGEGDYIPIATLSPPE